MVEGNAALVGVENLPLAEVGRIFGSAIGRREQGFGKRLGQRASRDGDAKDGRIAREGGPLRVEDVLAEVRGEVLVDVREGVEVGGFAHVAGCLCEGEREDDAIEERSRSSDGVVGGKKQKEIEERWEEDRWRAWRRRGVESECVAVTYRAGGRFYR